MSFFLWSMALLLLAGLSAYAWYTRHPTFADIAEGKSSLPYAEVEALKALVADAGVEPGRVCLLEAGPDDPCWNWTHWSLVDRALRVYKRFGAYPGSLNCIGLDGDRVVSLSFVGTRLSRTEPLTRLQGLRRLKLLNNRIETLAKLPEGCPWVEVILAENDLTDLAPLTACTNLERLDVSFNRLTSLPDLRPLRRLERLDAHNNALEDVRGLQGHPSLRQLFLGNNRLTKPEDLTDLPWLETLHLAGNALSTLNGLLNLPALRSLFADNNRLRIVEADVIRALPALQHVSLRSNQIQAMPPGFVYDGRGTRPIRIHPADSIHPAVELDLNPVAEALAAEAVAAHDSKKVYQVDTLPRGHGYANRTTTQGQAGGGVLGAHVDYRGTIGSLNGTLSKSFNGLDRQLGVQVTASVGGGRLRVYLSSHGGGYHYAEAIPGKAIDMHGQLISSGTGYFVYFESVEGTARDIVWTVRG